jgi:3-keto-disaccharide hydrolase
MRTFKIAVLAGGLLLAACADTASHATDFGGWHAIGGIPWRTDGGTAEAGPYEKAGFDEMGFLVSPESHADFRISVEFWIDADTNSGILIRCASADTITPTVCYEINIWDEHPNQDARTGAIVMNAKPLAHVDTAGRWNTCVIEAVGGNVTATIDGVLTSRLTGAKLRAGYVALQHAGGGVVRFRNLVIESL